MNSYTREALALPRSDLGLILHSSGVAPRSIARFLRLPVGVVEEQIAQADLPRRSDADVMHTAYMNVHEGHMDRFTADGLVARVIRDEIFAPIVREVRDHKLRHLDVQRGPSAVVYAALGLDTSRFPTDVAAYFVETVIEADRNRPAGLPDALSVYMLGDRASDAVSQNPEGFSISVEQRDILDHAVADVLRSRDGGAYGIPASVYRDILRNRFEYEAPFPSGIESTDAAYPDTEVAQMLVSLSKVLSNRLDPSQLPIVRFRPTVLAGIKP